MEGCVAFAFVFRFRFVLQATVVHHQGPGSSFQRQFGKERNVICERQYQNIGHRENVNDYWDIWPCTILVQAYDNQQQKGISKEKQDGPMAV
jgi:hypothetical protein